MSREGAGLVPDILLVDAGVGIPDDRRLAREMSLLGASLCA